MIYFSNINSAIKLESNVGEKQINKITDRKQWDDARLSCVNYNRQL